MRAESVSGPSWRERAGLLWNSQTQFLRIAATMAAIVLVVGIAWYASQRFYAPTRYASITLAISAADRAEGAQAAKIRLPLGADVLRLHLTLPENFDQAANFRVELVKDSGETRNLTVLAREGQSLVVDVAASELQRGQYVLKVYLFKPDGSQQRIPGSYLLTAE